MPQNNTPLSTILLPLSGTFICALLALYMMQLPIVTTESLLAFGLLGVIAATGLSAMSASATPRLALSLAMLAALMGFWASNILWFPQTAPQTIRQDVPSSQQKIHLNLRPATQSSLSSAYLYTSEAFTDYWAQLKPGGILTLQTTDEHLYMRALLSVWEALEAQPADGSDRLVEQGWGFRISANAASPQSFYLLLAKGPLSDEMRQHTQAWAVKQHAIALFGPGIYPPASYDIRTDPYNILYHPEGLMIARTAFNDAAAWHLKLPTDLTPTSDDRPFFSKITPLLPTLPKTIIAISLGALILALLFPLGGHRIFNNETTLYPPLPAYLGHGALVAAAAMATVTALSFQSGRFIGNSGLAMAAAWLGMLIGIVLGTASSKKMPPRFTPWLALAGTVLLALMPLMISNIVFAQTWAPVWRATLTLTLALPVGWLASMLFLTGLRLLPSHLTMLQPWHWSTAGLAAISSSIGSIWIAQSLGWTAVWLSSSAIFASVFLLGIWLRWPVQYPQTTTGPVEVKGI